MKVTLNLILFFSIITLFSCKGNNHSIQYIIAYVSPNPKSKVDVSKDILIFVSQEYFNRKRDLNNLEYGSYYAGWIYYTNTYLIQKDREVTLSRPAIHLFIIIGATGFVMLFVFLFFVWRDNKKEKSEICEYAERYDEIKTFLFSEGEKYPKIEAEIKSIVEGN